MVSPASERVILGLAGSGITLDKSQAAAHQHGICKPICDGQWCQSRQTTRNPSIHLRLGSDDLTPRTPKAKWRDERRPMQILLPTMPDQSDRKPMRPKRNGADETRKPSKPSTIDARSMRSDHPTHQAKGAIETQTRQILPPTMPDQSIRHHRTQSEWRDERRPANPSTHDARSAESRPMHPRTID